MKLYLAPGACSQAPHIALNEAGLGYEMVKVDIPTRTTEAGDDFTRVNPKGYVPALVLDEGEVLTENVAIITWIAEQAPHLIPPGPLGRIRMIEALGFMTEELHKPFLAYMFLPGDEMKAINKQVLGERFDYLAGQLKGDYLFGNDFSGADAYLFVMASWAPGLDIALPAALEAYHARIAARPAVQATLKAEGLA
ncbi:glutathione S-transferase N-terminal domain-containing protein [Kumtagia ephedrae]|uniref:Glutathione S-transferase n=1 Tax=Kumtagia ephedrae TaxID=2116701 RepID=A0A2P7S9P6_9HYPH|nr:glutathione S-transferase N-terminal domain-containing protein [Mesorhizobium ephedrae]PSJ59187.1 glutathione S-transferase [Mesorhizobium ephedrae]